MTAPSADTTTDLHGLVARLRAERDAALSEKASLANELAARTAELVARNSEYGERMEHQSATLDVLKAMSASPDDTQPVFDLIVRQALRLCGGMVTGLFMYDGTQVHHPAWYSEDPESIAAHAALAAQFPMPPSRGHANGRAILDARLVHVKDVWTDPLMSSEVVRLKERTILAAPLMRDGRAIGALAMNKREPGGFSESQVALLQTFAEQAVIAVSSAEIYRALQTRTTDLQESLEYQTATSDVLKVISRSTFDLQPVLAMVAEAAARLCVADQATLARHVDGTLQLAANWGFPPEYEVHVNEMGPIPVGADVGAQTVSHRAILERQVIHIPDVAAVPGYPDAPIRLGQQRTSLGVPLLREGEPVGVILLARRRVEPFTERQIELVKTFADQAVIAIENTRLLTEQREALEQQTAMAEVLRIIAESAGDLRPVFDAILSAVLRLSDSAFGGLGTYDGELLHIETTRGIEAASSTVKPQPGTMAHRVLIGGEDIAWLPDIRDDEAYRAGVPARVRAADVLGARTQLMVALRKEGKAIGLINIFRTEVKPFTETQIALVRAFADQAVIAMENARLLTEQREALERQTATAEVLQVINSSPGNLAPVFDALLKRALQLCAASFGTLLTFDGDNLERVALLGVPAAFSEWRGENPLTKDAALISRGIASGKPVQATDIMTDERMASAPHGRDALTGLGGVRALLQVPLLKDGTVVGFIVIYRNEPGQFPEKQIALLEAFAAQAVIAMENARLLIEQQEALERQTATAEVLQVINANPGDLTPVFEAILEKAHNLCGAALGSLVLRDGENLRAVTTRGYPDEYAALVRAGFPTTWIASFEKLLVEPFVQVADMSGTSDPSPIRRAATELAGIRTVLLIPLRKEGRLLGYMSAQRREVRLFSDKQIALLQNFAAQAVIAIENARLLSEEREALEQQTATAEVLRVINESPGDLMPVFNTLLEKAMRLCEAEFGELYDYDGHIFRPLALLGVPPEYATYRQQRGDVGAMSEPDSMAGRITGGESVVHIVDLMDSDAYRNGNPGRRAMVDLGGARTAISVALRKDGELRGGVVIYRQEARAFSDKQVALLENFAAQAVIAMENARLLTEQREALEQQTAMAEVLRVINASPGNLIPVFDAILEKAHALCGASMGALLTYDGEFIQAVATRGYSSEADALARSRRPLQPIQERVRRGDRLLHIPDLCEVTNIDDFSRTFMERTGARTYLMVPLRKDDIMLGMISVIRREVRPFSENEITLLENFAAQAVIGIDNARLLNEVRQRQEELRVTFENMGDGVALFDEAHNLVAWNRRFQDVLDLPDDMLSQGESFSDYIRTLAARGEFGADADGEEEVRRVTGLIGQQRTFERARPNGRTVEVRNNPVADGGFVLIYTDITERKRAEAEIAAARDAAEEAARNIEAAYRDLKAAQANLVQAEKMASLGQLTAGIAHEIKNPLNFVNNFSDLSVDLLAELKDAVALRRQAEIDELSATLKGNLEKIAEHGRRADGIVRSMLEHSRGGTGERRTVELNNLVDEALNLAYHGARAQDQSFNITLQRDLAEGMAPIDLVPQDITRVLLNLIGNGFYAATRRAQAGADAGFVPTLKVTTCDLGEVVEIRVRDNGTGIPDDIRDKLFQPFFTTKPTGEGTGLGLSISYDIVTSQHGGSITVDSQVGQFSEFIVRLPRNRRS